METKSNLFKCLLYLLLFLNVLYSTANGKIIYVDDDATGLNDGSSWENAYVYLQDALADVNDSEKPVEIRVAQGIYKPDQGASQTSSDKTATFQLINGVTIIGGYAGLYANESNVRDVKLYETILSGDLNGDDTDVVDPCDLLDEPSRTENSFNVVTGSNTNETAILDGFIITAGNANSSITYTYGGGIFNDMGSPTLTNCIIRRNLASFGGGLACGNLSDPEITNCTISENIATSGGGGIGSSHNSKLIISNCLISNNISMRYGGGIFPIDSNAMIIDCTISENRARSYGGGIYCENMTPIISNCSITKNVADFGGGGIGCLVSNPLITNCIINGNKTLKYHGGGIYCGRSSPSIVNCLITENESAVDGGGIHCFSSIYGQSSPTVTNCTIANNFAERNGGGIGCENSSILTATNCIIWDNSSSHAPQILNDNAADTFLFNCNVQGGWHGEGNIDVDPLFADPIKGDHHLKSQAGRWNPNSGSWIFDYITSPCIDAGDPNSSVGDEPEPNGGRINMGAYGGTAEASKSYILAKIIYVDDDAPGLNDGSSWENAYTFLQDALVDANDSEKPIEIRVAQGTYIPNQGLLPLIPAGVGGRTGPYPATYPADLGNRASFNLINNVTIKGGYAGLGEPDPNARDIELNVTILSGDLNSDDIEVNDPCDLINEPNRNDNSWHIVAGSDINETAVLSGFTITAGFGPWGAGMDIDYGSPTLINCIFTGNTAYHDYGGGICLYGGNPTLVNCIFNKNYGRIGGGMCSISSSPTLMNCAFTNNYAELGAGMRNQDNVPRGEPTQDSNSTLINCTFNDNKAHWGGGINNVLSYSNLSNCTFDRNYSRGMGAGMYNYGGNIVMKDCSFVENTGTCGGGIYSEDICNLTISNCILRNNIARATGGGGMSISDANNIFLSKCTFSGNSANWSGGGLASNHNRLMLNNCIFSGNNASGDMSYTGKGGGLYAFGDSTLSNCTFSCNWAQQGCAIFKYSFSNLELTNCILWNGGNEIYQTGIKSDIRYSNIQGGWEGEGNIDTDPLFADPNNGDFHLKSQAGRYDSNIGSWIMDDITSPCIDAGDPNSPIGDEPFPNSGIINMGAYGGTAEASLSTYILFGQASNPNPPDGTQNVSPDVIISWSPGKDAVSHDVYFGFTNPPMFVRNQIETEYEPGQLYSQGLLPTQAQCYWRIDEVDSQGNIITGNVWEFKVHEYKGRFCFTGDTPVLVDGKLIPMSEVAAGQSIENNIGKVETVQEHEGVFTLYDIVLDSGNPIAVAENHYFLTEAGNWLSLHNLKAGSRLKTSKGSVGIIGVKKRPMPYIGKVYNIKIKDSNQYLVGEDAIIVRDY